MPISGNPFTGDVVITPVHGPRPPSRLSATHVRFAPGARTYWHRHDLGQLLICTEGVGLVGSRDGTPIELRPGDSVWTPPGEEHWHGAAHDSSMSHYGFLEHPDHGADATVWLEPVDEEQYRAFIPGP